MISKPIRWMLWAGIITVLLVSAITATVSFVLPVYVENNLIPDLADEFGLTTEQVHVRRIGWYGTDLGSIRFSMNGAPAVDMAALQIDYSPVTLLQGKIKGIAVVGLDVEMSVTPKGVSIAGIKPLGKPTATDARATEFDLRTLLPIKLGRLSILQSQLLINMDNRRHTIPFELELQTSRLGAGYLDARADLAVDDNPVTLAISMDQSAGRAKVTVDTQGFSLDRLSQFGRMPSQINAAGTVNLAGRGTVEMQPFKFTEISIRGEFLDTQIAFPNGVLKNAVTNQGDPKSIIFSIDGESPAKLQWHLAPFNLSSLVNLDVDGFKGDLYHNNDQWSVTSAIKTLIPKQRLLDRGDIETDLAMAWRMTARGANSDSIEFQLGSEMDGPFMAAIGNRKLSSQKHAIRVTGHYRDSTLYAEGKLTAGDILAQLPEGKITATLLDLNAAVTIPPANSAIPPSMTVHGTMPHFRSKFETASIHLPKITLKASGEGDPHHPWQFNARLNLANGRVIDPSNGLRMTNLSMVLPLKYPDPTGAEPGRIKISAIKWKNRPMGGVKGTLQQTRHGLTMNFRHTSKLFPGMNVLVNGDIDASGARLNAEIPPHQLADDIDMGRFVPAAAGIQITGQIGASGKLTADGSGVRTSGRFTFNQGRLSEETQEFILEGMDMEIQMDDLIQMKSAPAQRLRISKLSLGNLTADQLDIDFQIEDRQTLFVEKAGVSWSQGKINTSSIRIIADKEDYDVTLFCDRLNLALVLEQLGAAKASGDGTVSGRIPIRWAKGRLSFDNGFLYSAPGQSGAIQLTGTQMLLSGLPPGSPQHTQLDIATEALKDYTYKWAKLNVISEGEVLLLKLQFDGKPNRLMPFAYDQSLGQFKRVAGEGQADFTGISIDLNFRSPLNDIINYKDLLRQQN